MTKPVTVDACADGSEQQLTRLIGASVVSIHNDEYSLMIRFDNGLELTAAGGRWEGCALGVDVDKSPA